MASIQPIESAFPVSCTLTMNEAVIESEKFLQSQRWNKKKKEKSRNIGVNHIANFKYSCWAAAATEMLFVWDPSLLVLQEKGVGRPSIKEGFSHVCLLLMLSFGTEHCTALPPPGRQENLLGRGGFLQWLQAFKYLFLSIIGQFLSYLKTN